MRLGRRLIARREGAETKRRPARAHLPSDFEIDMLLTTRFTPLTFLASLRGLVFCLRGFDRPGQRDHAVFESTSKPPPFTIGSVASLMRDLVVRSRRR